MESPFTIAIICASVACLSGCLTSDSVDPSEETDPPGFRTASFAYSLETGKIIITPFTRIHRECSDTGLSTETLITQSTALPYELEGDSLKLMQGGPQTVRLGTVIRIYNAFARVGRGTGLKGRWVLISQGYRVVSGEASAEDYAQFDRMMASSDMERPFTDVQHVFSEDSIAYFIDTKNAERFIAGWNGLDSERPEDVDSANYAISLRIIERDVVELKGLKSGETVRLRMGNDRSRDYSSDVSAHVPHHNDDTPESCPNEYGPIWYWDFLEANRIVIPE